MVRLTDYAYNKMQLVYASFMEKVSSNPEMYHVYAGRRVTLSEVVSMVMEAELWRMRENTST